METLTMTHHDSSATFECHFDTYTGSLWNVMIGDDCIYNLLSPAVIRDFEQNYLAIVKRRDADLALEIALENAND
jgi:hypothetical protein